MGDEEVRTGLRGYGFRADHLKRRRLRLRLTQKELAVRVGMSVSQISRLETGTHVPHFSTIDKLASAIDADPDYLIRYPDEDDDPPDGYDGEAGGPTEAIDADGPPRRNGSWVPWAEQQRARPEVPQPIG